MAIRHREGRKKPWEVYWNNPFTLKRESLYVETEEEAKKQDALKKYQLRYERDLFRKEGIRRTEDTAYDRVGVLPVSQRKEFQKEMAACPYLYDEKGTARLPRYPSP